MPQDFTTNQNSGNQDARRGRRALQIESQKHKTYGKDRSVRLSNYSYDQPNVQYAVTVCCADRGPRLADPALAKIVYDTFLEVLPNRGYSVLALCIMPDHVHVVMLSEGGCIVLGRAIGEAKSLACKRAGRDVIRWQEKFHDHLIRSDEDIDNQIQYVINNPVRAGLADDWRNWPWTYAISGYR